MTLEDIVKGLRHQFESYKFQARLNKDDNKNNPMPVYEERGIHFHLPDREAEMLIGSLEDYIKQKHVDLVEKYGKE